MFKEEHPVLNKERWADFFRNLLESDWCYLDTYKGIVMNFSWKSAIVIITPVLRDNSSTGGPNVHSDRGLFMRLMHGRRYGNNTTG